MAASCVASHDEMPPDEGQAATLNFSVRAPGLSRGGQTRAFPVDYEERIDDIMIFLAHDNGSGFIMDSMVTVEQFRPVSDNTQAFSMKLPTSVVPAKIFVVANLLDADNNLAVSYRAAFDQTNGKGMDEEAFITLLADNWSEVASDGSCMYMAGSVVLPTITKGENNLHIPLLRWIARADVVMALDADSRPFVPTEVTLWHGYRDACVLAGAAAYDPENAARVLTPTLANSTRLDADVPIAIPVTGDPSLIATTYVGEHDASATDADKLEAPCLILGGYFNGSTTPGYYRIDFDSQIDGHPFGQVLRNWHYVFNVTKVMSRGYDTPAEAAANPAHSIVIEVEMWEENVQQVNFTGTGDYMYVNTLEVPLNYNQGDVDTFVVRSTLPFDWGFDTATTTPSTSDDALSDANFSVSITAREDNVAYTDYTFTVTTLADNTSNDPNQAGIFISAQNAIMSLELTQRAQRVTERTVNVLSLTDDIGSMGIYFIDATGNVGGNNMRNILTNTAYFGPNGVVKCGGLTFDRYQTGDITQSTTVSLDKLQRALDATDILVTCYADDPPQSVVDMILQWASKPYHVLFVAADAGGVTPLSGTPTNVLLRENLESSPVFDNQLTWYNIEDWGSSFGPTLATSNNAKMTAALGTDYLSQLYAENNNDNPFPAGEPVNMAVNSIAIADQTPENAAFMAGPFGAPNADMTSTSSTYRLWDGVAEWAVPAPTSPVVPLLVVKANIFGYSSYNAVVANTHGMMLGVDTTHTVVYMGENQLFEGYLLTAPPSGTVAGGAVGTPYYNSVSTLMSNIWAWAVKNVLAQVKEE